MRIACLETSELSVIFILTYHVVGQCGNQIGGRFWDLILQEHSTLNKKGIYDDALATFFRNVDIK